MPHEKSERAQFIIIHGFAPEPGECLPSEEILAIFLIYRRRWYWIPWGPTHLILVDFLCRNRRLALDAWQIAARMQEDPFVAQHGLNAPGHEIRPARTSRSNVRQQVKRSREELAALIAEEQLDLDAWEIIRSEKTSTRTVRYRVCADVTWKHLPSLDAIDNASNIAWVHPRLFGEIDLSNGSNLTSGV